MSFLAKSGESSQTYKKLVFLGLFYELMYNFCTGIKIIFLDSRFRGKALLRGPKNLFGVTPWLDHGIHKNNKNTNNFSIFNWIPWSSHGMTEVKLIHATTPSGNDIEKHENDPLDLQQCC